MKALVFPGQGAQFVGMGQALYEQGGAVGSLFDIATDILGFDLKKIMFEGTAEDLQKTSVTQPAIFVHSVAAAFSQELDEVAGMTAGHSLGEFSALVASGALSFTDGLRLVSIRANAMQKACDIAPSTMAAIVGLEDAVVEAICTDASQPGEVVVPANYNTVGQLVISGAVPAIERAIQMATDQGARLAKALSVNGAFHSPFMEPARIELAAGIEDAPFMDANIPVYQNVTAMPATDQDVIKRNLLAQLTAPVRWTQTMQRMIEGGATEFVEAGPGNVLRGLLKRVDRKFPASGVS